MRLIGIAAALAFVATVWAANYAVEHWGVVSVGFGLTAPAGVYFAGLAFTLRDIVQRALGRWVVIAAILLGAALSYWISDAVTLERGLVSLAVASGLAFLISELSDLAVYEPIRERCVERSPGRRDERIEEPTQQGNDRRQTVECPNPVAPATSRGPSRSCGDTRRLLHRARPRAAADCRRTARSIEQAREAAPLCLACRAPTTPLPPTSGVAAGSRGRSTLRVA